MPVSVFLVSKNGPPKLITRKTYTEVGEDGIEFGEREPSRISVYGDTEKLCFRLVILGWRAQHDVGRHMSHVGDVGKKDIDLISTVTAGNKQTESGDEFKVIVDGSSRLKVSAI
jgi:hypothetical protein